MPKRTILSIISSHESFTKKIQIYFFDPTDCFEQTFILSKNLSHSSLFEFPQKRTRHSCFLPMKLSPPHDLPLCLGGCSPLQVRHEVLQSFTVRRRQQGESLADGFQLLVGVWELWRRRAKRGAPSEEEKKNNTQWPQRTHPAGINGVTSCRGNRST